MKKMIFILADASNVAFDNDFDTNNRAYVPEIWAQESLMVLEENLVAANLVHRSFENEIAEYGDVVNTRRPGKFEAVRKIDSDEVTVQDASAEKVQVKLNQHLHTSFLIKDGEMSKSFKELVSEYLTPAVKSIANAVDQIVLSSAYQFLDNKVGQLGVDPTKETVIAANTLMNNNNVPGGVNARNFILSPNAEGALLAESEFTKVNEAGDNGVALQQALLGNKFGFSFYMDQNTPSIAATQTVATRTIDKTGGYAKGTKTFVCDAPSSGEGTLAAGQWITIAGDMTPLRVTAATSTSITTAQGISHAIEDGATITIYPAGTINYSSGYDAGWVKALTTADFTDAPLKGQMVSNGSDIYGAIGTPTLTSLNLNRETQSDLANDDTLNLGPAGDYSLAIHPNAIALVTRPLITVPAQYGASQAVVNYNGLSMRVSLQYDGTKQGMLVTTDMLCGIKVLDTSLGVVMLG